MKKLINEIVFGKNSIVSGIIALSVISAIGLGCFCNKDKFNNLANSSSSSPTPNPSPSPSPTKAYTKADASKTELPSDDEMQDIVRATLLDFNDAIKKGDFNDFHKTIAKKWQDQITPEKFKQSFSLFVEKKLDISGVKTQKAEFTSGPKIDKSRGLKELIVEGKYNITPLPVKFKLNYVPEGKEWKLYGIELDTRRD